MGGISSPYTVGNLAVACSGNTFLYSMSNEQSAFAKTPGESFESRTDFFVGVDEFGQPV